MLGEQGGGTAAQGARRARAAGTLPEAVFKVIVHRGRGDQKVAEKTRIIQTYRKLCSSKL